MFSKVKGTRDLNICETTFKDYNLNLIKDILNEYGFQRVETPIIEHSELFKRSVEGSDLVNKEMYDFIDKGNREITLRPEGTASFVRAYVENKWFANNMHQKFYYYGPMFRYEQPQKGRYRQFDQLGVEFVGDKNPYKDADVIALGNLILNEVELKNFRLEINSVGDEESRRKYQQALQEYFKDFYNELSETSKKRFDQGNCLRILDDKEDSQKPFMQNVPQLKDYLSEASRQYFNDLLAILDEKDIKYVVSNKLVRGLDYYDEIVFEFIAIDKNAGSQNAVIGGGRYSRLINQLGGPELSSVGFGLGIDRLLSILYDNNNSIQEQSKKASEDYFVYVAFSNNKLALRNFFIILDTLRQEFGWLRFYFEYDLVKSKKVLDRANKVNARFLITDNQEGLIYVKDLQNKNSNIHTEFIDPQTLEFEEDMLEHLSEIFEEEYQKLQGELE
ncbi:histidine--tRNA ligase [Mycoplasmopsis gallinacea]|uniref:Histidine--tRNA ligase n=1 Tax=Mycoplasmopsis gallinacea TaxID=29556 RepID=A0A449A281_9BACT|nr:histidine--tRNA ligase [Mycoplasmopsis gallinacea]VEU58347.1 Histidyl-tRNA synthetase [Mycoplasmopsis gallinacea]